MSQEELNDKTKVSLPLFAFLTVIGSCIAAGFSVVSFRENILRQTESIVKERYVSEFNKFKLEEYLNLKYEVAALKAKMDRLERDKDAR